LNLSFFFFLLFVKELCAWLISFRLGNICINLNLLGVFWNLIYLLLSASLFSIDFRMFSLLLFLYLLFLGLMLTHLPSNHFVAYGLVGLSYSLTQPLRKVINDLAFLNFGYLLLQLPPWVIHDNASDTLVMRFGLNYMT
jgi:hypothetical protein